jgi:hypothetical protein
MSLIPNINTSKGKINISLRTVYLVGLVGTEKVKFRL